MDPECDKALKKAIAKQASVCGAICLIPFTLFIIIMTIILGEASFASPYYNVAKDYSTGMITCTPKQGNHT